MAGVLTYDPKRVMVIFGTHQIHGMSEDDIVSVSPLGDGMQIHVGADGEVARSIDPNHCYEVTISLATTSKSNDYLSNMFNLDGNTGGGIAPLLIKDLAGSTLFYAAQAWVQNAPEMGKHRTVDTQEWTLNTGYVENPIFGGNN